MPRTIAFLNQKGGVGKTSTVHHLGGTLASRGLKVLAVDADPQASLTQGLLGPDVAEDLDPRETIAAIFDDSCAVQACDLVARPALPTSHFSPAPRPHSITTSPIPGIPASPNSHFATPCPMLRAGSISS